MPSRLACRKLRRVRTPDRLEIGYCHEINDIMIALAWAVLYKEGSRAPPSANCLNMTRCVAEFANFFGTRMSSLA